MKKEKELNINFRDIRRYFYETIWLSLNVGILFFLLFPSGAVGQGLYLIIMTWIYLTPIIILFIIIKSIYFYLINLLKYDFKTTFIEVGKSGLWLIFVGIPVSCLVVSIIDFLREDINIFKFIFELIKSIFYLSVDGYNKFISINGGEEGCIGFLCLSIIILGYLATFFDRLKLKKINSGYMRWKILFINITLLIITLKIYSLL